MPRFHSLFLLQIALLRVPCNAFVSNGRVPQLGAQAFFRQQRTFASLQTNRQLPVQSLEFVLNVASNNAISDTHDIGDGLHNINGIICREVSINVKNIGPIKILEATAESQDELVEMACATEDEILEQYGSEADQHLIQSGDPYGSVLWPAASAVSDYLLTTVVEESSKGSLEGLTILELGTGTGLCALTSALGGASKVMATDYEPIPLKLLEYAAASVNVQVDGNGFSSYNEDLDEEARKIRLSRIETCE